MITRNEEGAVGRVVDGVLAVLPGAEVVVVDGSSDATPRVAAEHGATVVREPGGGPAPALVCALTTPERPLVATIDADDTYPVEVFVDLVAMVDAGVDVAGTNRLAGGRPAAMPLANYVANQVFNLLASARARRRLRDVHSGQRVYRREVIEAFAWDTDGLALPVDLLLWPACRGFRVREIPIPYRERVGQTTLVRLPGTMWTLRRLLRPRRRMAAPARPS